jgi:peptidoglycan/LPS O-acetylase OafA/YrhL
VSVQTHHKIEYRPDIDGLRAIAVGIVVVFHAFPQALPGGYVGVDVFFVISGYLISGILFSDMESGRYSILEFYYRRFRRIFPALILVMVASLVYGRFFIWPHQYLELAKEVAAGAGFVANFVLEPIRLF